MDAYIITINMHVSIIQVKSTFNYNANGTELLSLVFDDNNANLPHARLSRLAGIIAY